MTRPWHSPSFRDLLHREMIARNMSADVRDQSAAGRNGERSMHDDNMSSNIA